MKLHALCSKTVGSILGPILAVQFSEKKQQKSIINFLCQQFVGVSLWTPLDVSLWKSLDVSLWASFWKRQLYPFRIPFVSLLSLWYQRDAKGTPKGYITPQLKGMPKGCQRDAKGILMCIPPKCFWKRWARFQNASAHFSKKVRKLG